MHDGVLGGHLKEKTLSQLKERFYTFTRSLVLIHWLAILFRRGYSPSPSPPSVGTGFGCGRSESHHTVSESRSVHAAHTMHMNQARSH